jgi:predicted PurR-regulated permease PerM
VDYSIQYFIKEVVKMSIFSILGQPEPQWAKNFKTNVIAPDTLPNPLKKTQSASVNANTSKISGFFKNINTGLTGFFSTLFKDFTTIVIIGIVIFILYLFRGRK